MVIVRRMATGKRFGTGVLTLLVLLATGACSSATSSGGATRTSTIPPPSSVPPTTPCVPPAGGRCGGPAPVERWLVGPLLVSADGRTLAGRFQCGGRLSAREAPGQVTLTFVASSVGAGAMSCALVPVSVALRSPLGTRTLVDGVTHQVLPAPSRAAVRPLQ